MRRTLHSERPGSGEAATRSPINPDLARVIETWTMLPADVGASVSSFTAECKVQREQHHRDMIISRDNVHDVRDMALSCVGLREMDEELKKRQDTRRPPESTV